MKKFLFFGWIFSAISFLASTTWFLIIFLFKYSHNFTEYVICLLLMLIFALVYLRLDDMMKKRTTCSWIECIYFYKKCKAAGMTSRLKLSDNDREILKKCAENNIYFAKIEREELFKIYIKGMNICDKKKNKQH